MSVLPAAVLDKIPHLFQYNKRDVLNVQPVPEMEAALNRFKAPYFETCATSGHGVFEAYFPDGSIISYGRQQIDRRGSRFVLPIQAKARIAAPWRAAFDYHCKLDMPADPISPAARADCIF